jgi:hypothetical protein
MLCFGVVRILPGHFRQTVIHAWTVKAPQEATLDSQVLLKASTLGAQKARAMRSATGAFDLDDFVAKLITFMGGRNPLEDRVLDDSDDSDAEVDELEYPLDWEKIGRRALAKSRRVPTIDFMYACFESILPFFKGLVYS